MHRSIRRVLTGGGLALAALLPAALSAQDAIGLALGTQAPAASVQDLEGKPVELLSLVPKGKPALLEFWATWCEQCEQLQPQLDRIQKEMGSQINVVAVAVGVAQTPRRVKRHLEDHNPGYAYVFDARGDAVRKYDAATTSIVMLLDKNGKVVYANVGPDQDLVGAVKKLLGTTTQQ
ncbi:MAG: TlpA family protein disulfide reductase [Gemmatimonadetes bacterium]|nr:TlpA family protein disulfide reductase [Gemmatimonadota bacterium]